MFAYVFKKDPGDLGDHMREEKQAIGEANGNNNGKYSFGAM